MTQIENWSIVMDRLVNERLHVRFLQGVDPGVATLHRYSTLIHSDRTGDLFLTVGPNYSPTWSRSQVCTRV